MSNAQAVAAITATLQAILLNEVPLGSPDLADLSVSILPLDKARGANTNNQLNLFLYMVNRNAAFANADMPRQVQSGEVAISPLPLNLYYLVTAFGRDDDVVQPFGHELLGKAMSVLYDHPILRAADITSATQTLLPDNDLASQVERVRITMHPLTIDELSKLWTGFSMQYRLSAAYEVGVALIESTRGTQAGLPVLTRGPGDQGVAAQSNLLPPEPTLTGVTPPNAQPSARLNDVVTLSGFNLNGSNISVLLTHPLLHQPVPVVPNPGGTATNLAFKVPNTPAVLPAGFYTVTVMVQRPGETFQRPTNAAPLALAPTATLSPASAPAGTIAYTATVSPDVLPAQRASLLLGSTEIVADAHLSQTGALTFTATDVVAGEYWFRIRVDGVDTHLIDRTKIPPAYDPTQKVTVT
jgi:Pvc16 N-terminal domain